MTGKMIGKIAVFYEDDYAFVSISDAELLCIGLREEAQKADGKQLLRLIEEARAMAAFQSIQKTRGITLH